MWCVYMIKSAQKNWYYIGSTDSLTRRLSEHNKGRVISTKRYIPLKLVFLKELKTEKEAREYEKRLKKRRKEKEELIRKIENKNL